MRPSRPQRPDITVAPGERVLAWAVTGDGTTVAGTRDALYISSVVEPVPSVVEPAPSVVEPVPSVVEPVPSVVEPVETRIPWEQVEAADWDGDTSVLRVAEVGSWGAPRPEHQLQVAEPGRLIELVRERVTASVVLQRHVAVHGRRGVFVIARRAPRGDRPMHWVFEFEDGIDPEDPVVRRAAEAALAAAQDEVGLR